MLNSDLAADIAQAVADWEHWNNLRTEAVKAHTARIRANHPSNPNWEPSAPTGFFTQNGHWVQYGLTYPNGSDPYKAAAKTHSGR